MKVVVLLEKESAAEEYAMFELHSLQAEGAKLSGPLFLEVGEQMRLRLSEGDTKIDLVAKVTEVTPDHALMAVEFVGLDEAAKKSLAEHVR